MKEWFDVMMHKCASICMQKKVSATKNIKISGTSLYNSTRKESIGIWRWMAPWWRHLFTTGVVQENLNARNGSSLVIVSVPFGFLGGPEDHLAVNFGSFSIGFCDSTEVDFLQLRQVADDIGSEMLQLKQKLNPIGK